MKIQINKKYKQRNGREITIHGKNKNGSYTSKDTGFKFNENGGSNAIGKGSDLILN